MNNIFQIGGKVEGASFIGRTKQMEYFRKVYLESGGRTGKAIVGLTRTGKSSIALNLFKNLPDSILYIYEDLNEWSEYAELWQDICCSVENYLNKHNKMTVSMAESLKTMEDGNLLPWIKLNQTIKKIFEELSILQVKTILVLDEFDNATALFNAGTKHFELFRTIFSEGKYDVSAMTISRRSLHMIEGTTYQSSSFHGVLDSIPLKGFNDDDMLAYYKVFENLNIALSEEQKEEIEYYAGRAPFLLSIMGHYIVEEAELGNSVDITSIFQNKCKAINDYYRDCIQHLKRDNDLKRIIPFAIGPNVGVTQNDRDELINLGYLREEGSDLIAISRYFVNFISANMLQLNIWDNVINLEKKIKLIIESEFANIVDYYRVGGESIVAIQRNILAAVEGITNGDISRYESFIANNAKVFNIKSTYLDVLSLNDSFKILKDCWTGIFAKYFGNDLYSNWSFKFDKCSRARNPIAHGHEEYLTDLDKSEVDTYCKQIFDALAASGFVNIFPSDEAKVLSTAARYTCDKVDVTEIEYKEPVASLLGKEADFVVIKRGGTKRNNLSGVIQEKYRGTIPKNFLNGLNLDTMIGKTLRVTVERIDGNRYLLSYAGNIPSTVADIGTSTMEYSIASLVTSAIQEQ